MDWLELIRQFKPMKSAEAPQFAPGREKDQAVAAYNRALVHIGQDSMDIALIALKKLSATYPQFYQAAVLLAYCQAYTGHYTDAGASVQSALDAGLPGELAFHALEAQKKIERLIARQKQAEAAGAMKIKPKTAVRKLFSKRPAVRMSDAILKKTGRHSAVKMASEKERQTVIRQANTASQGKAPRAGRRKQNFLRIGLFAFACMLMAGLLIWAGVAFIPSLVQNGRENREAQSRLAWLISRLEQLSAQNPAIMDILDDYRMNFDEKPAASPAGSTEETTAATLPSTETTTEQAAETTTRQMTETATTVITASQAELDLAEASRLYGEAVETQGSDLAGAAGDLLSARHLLAGVPSGTTSAGVAGTAAELGTAVEKMISELAFQAAGAFWDLGRAKFSASRYQDAIADFLKMYELDPGYYGGGGAYYCGRCYQLLGKYESAKPYYEYVVGHFAGRDIAAYAAGRLKEMGY